MNGSTETRITELDPPVEDPLTLTEAVHEDGAPVYEPARSRVDRRSAIG